MADFGNLASLGSTPIAGANPAGASARYEPEFEKLAAEISKLESVEGRSSIRWKDVIGNAATILSSKSKDLLAASYLAMGLLKERGYSGLAAGLGVVKDLLNNFWEGLFPEKTRMRARAQALQWLAERVAPEVAARSAPSTSDRESLTACVNALNEIAALAGKKIEEGGPDFGELRRAIDDKLAAASPEEPAAAQAAPSESSMAPAPRAVDTPEAARQALAELMAPLVRIAEVLRQASSTDPVPYRLLRAAIWSDFVAGPPAKEGQTDVAGGDATFTQQQEERLEKGEYAPLIEDCEAKFPSDPFWLDLHLWVYRAMEGLGRPFAAARKAVGDAVAGLARAVPALLELRFADGTPMAGEQTKLWILHELNALPSSGGVGGKAVPGEGALVEARKLAARKQFGEAVAVFQKELQSLPHRRDRFLCRLNLAKLCLEAGKLELALPQLEALDEEAKRFALDEWEPALAVELARELWKCYKSSPTPERAGECYARLCRLDLPAALAADGKR